MDSARTIEEHVAFRALLQAMARPGSIHVLAPEAHGRDGALEMLVRAVLDSETSLCAMRAQEDELVARLARASGCALVGLGQASWIVIGGGSAAECLPMVRMGSPDWPDESATLVYLVENLGEDGGDVTWTGPGILDKRTPRVDGVVPGEWARLRATNASYPIGLDCFFLDRAGRVMALPRSTRLQGGF